MVITATWPAGASPTSTLELAGTADGIPMTNLRVNGSRVIQDLLYFRANAQQEQDRLNRKTEVSFNATRVFTTPQAAEDFALQHEANMPQQLLDLKFVTADATYYLASCALVSMASEVIGSTTRHSYTFRGGAIGTTP